MRLVALLSGLLLTIPALADDGAASIAAGGLVLMKREPRIVMAKELLRISPSKIVVAYDFRNDSDTDITTIVAFPIPAYSYDPDGPRPQLAGFDDFSLLIDGHPAKYTIEARAFRGHQEFTAMLTHMGIDVASFGHMHCDEVDCLSKDLARLTATQKNRLSSLHLIESRTDLTPDWSVEKKYYWPQTFPAHKLVHIEHEYSPVLGGTNSVRYGFDAAKAANPTQDEKYTRDEVDSLCLAPSLRQKLDTLTQNSDTMVPFNYVDFILTTANTWKTPIEDFTLIVERTATNISQRDKSLISFCWNGPIEKLDANHFSAHTTNLIPQKELRIGFLYLDKHRNLKH